MRMIDVPWWNRPGYKLSKDKELNDAELLAIILEKGIKLDESSIDLANKLLSKYKSLAGLSDLSLTELKNEGRLSSYTRSQKLEKLLIIFDFYYI